MKLLTFLLNRVDLPNDLSPQAIFNYLTTASANVTPGNVLFALSPDVTEAWRDFAREFSIDFDERDTTIYDPLHTAPVAGTTGGIAIDVPVNYTYIASPFYNGVSTIFTPATKRNTKPIRYSGLAHTTTELPLLLPLLRAPATAFPIEKKDGPEAALVEGGPFVAGEQAKLVSGFQSRVNSRAVWSGSLDLFSDNFWTEETSNAAFIEDMTKWLFAEKNVVKVLGSRHYKTHDVNKYEHEQYRVGDEVTYELIVTEFDSERGGWFAPSSIHDLQLEVTMLDPHLRIPLHLSTRFEDRSNSNRTYTASFKLPDRHGVFTFLVDHRRQGMSWLEERTQISITPLRHDEYKRFIGGAMPYYLTVGSMVVAWLLFSATWLNLNQDEADTTKARKGNRVQIKQ
jgi:oligosaccharyltransferase complex subunit beta